MLHTPESRKALPFRLTRPEAALVGITMIWGTTFVVVHLAMREGAPLTFVGLRFVAAGLVTCALFARSLAGLTRRELGAGAAIGVAIFLGYGLQTYGLQTITGSQSAFITALYVPMVPLILWLVLRRPPHAMAWLGIGLAFAGLVLLAGPDASRVGLGAGEIATLIGAAAIAAEILLIGHFAPGVDARRVTAVQLLVAGLLALAIAPLAGEGAPTEVSAPVLGAAAALGCASAGIQLAMNWAQRTVSPTRATVIYAGEPVWAGLFGRLAGDRLPPLALVGGALIVAGVLASELRLRPRFGLRLRLGPRIRPRFRPAWLASVAGFASRLRRA